MTPEQIIDAMGRCVVDPEGEHRCDGCAYAEPNTYCLNRLKKDAYELMKRQAVGGWISVKDRIPARQIPVLVYVPPYSDDDEYFGYVGMAYHTNTASGGYWAGTDGNWYGAIGIIHEPSHWMPLPDPPKEADAG